MTFKIFLPFLLTFFISCSQRPTRTDDVYIVPQRQKPQVDTIPNEPPPPPPIQTYYLATNFIIDTSGEVYFYEHPQYGWFCGTGFNWDTPPEFINLKPKDIVQVPINSINDFIKLNILSLDSDNRRVAVDSVKDTIQSIGLSKILVVCNDNSNKIRWTFRKTTQEENVVLKFKKLNMRYNSEDIKWDSTKIWFPLKIDSTIKFTPPRIKNS
jgi:hypothetical protein